MTSKEALLTLTAALRDLATAIEMDVQTEAEALVLGAYLQPAVAQLSARVEHALDVLEAERRNLYRALNIDGDGDEDTDLSQPLATEPPEPQRRRR